MGAPRAQGEIVLLARDLDCLIARGVAVVVRELRALGAGDEVENGVIPGEHLLLGLAEMGKGLCKLRVGDIRLIVEHSAVIDDEHLVLRHHLRALEGEALLMQLILNDKILEILHTDAIAERADAEAGDKLRRRLGDGDDFPAVFLPELLEDAADERGFTRGGAAGENDAGDAFGH